MYGGHVVNVKVNQTHPNARPHKPELRQRLLPRRPQLRDRDGHR